MIPSTTTVVAVPLQPNGLPIPPSPYTWLGGGGIEVANINHQPSNQNDALLQLKVGWTRSSFGYDASQIDEEVFAWRWIQRNGPGSFDFSHVDTFFSYLQTLPPLKVVVELEVCGGFQEPAWASALSESDYVVAKSNFINTLAAYCGSKIWGIEVENEPQPWVCRGVSVDSSTAGYDLHLKLLQACQQTRAHTKLIGWTCQGAFATWLQYLLDNGLNNLCDATSWHCYVQGGITTGQVSIR